MIDLFRASLVSVLLTLPMAARQAFAQDLLGVQFDGTAVEVDSRSGAGVALGATGRSGHNCMARLDRQLYTTEHVGTGSTAQFFLNTIDNVTRIASRTVTLDRDIRGLAPGGESRLLAVAENGADDQLVSIDVADGSIAVIGSIGFSGVQGLTLHHDALFGWDVSAGLIRIDPATGAGTDINSTVGGSSDIQFLSTMADGRLVGGRNALFAVDVITGVTTRLGSGQYSDLRGAEERFGVMFPFGPGCRGVSMGLTGAAVSGSTITSLSLGHRRDAVGACLVGFSDRTFQGLSLPLQLDGMLGTVDCFLLTGPEIVFPGAVSALGSMRVQLAVPQFAHGLVFHVQHMALNSDPGTVALSNGWTVRVQL